MKKNIKWAMGLFITIAIAISGCQAGTAGFNAAWHRWVSGMPGAEKS